MLFIIINGFYVRLLCLPVCVGEESVLNVKIARIRRQNTSLCIAKKNNNKCRASHDVSMYLSIIDVVDIVRVHVQTV